MTAEESTQTCNDNEKCLYVLFPGIAMSLGWGLRGYIGGGPFGAMIPGCMVALTLCLLLRQSGSLAALAALFGAIGVGFGGQMTYGQTIGFIIKSETFWWGFTGLTLKGAVWGLLGGAMIGIGLNYRNYLPKDVVIALVLLILASFIGWKLINEPKLIYFSDPINKPRGESWAGLLLGAIVLIGYLKFRARSQTACLPLRFALWGALAGSIGFGGGGIWMAIGPNLSVNQQWYPWWKFMEFSFGLCFGIGLGLCTFYNRQYLDCGKQTDSPTEFLWKQVLLGIFVVAFVFWLWPAFVHFISSAISSEVSEMAVRQVLRSILRVFFGFTTLGVLLVLLGMAVKSLRWHIVITVTYCAAAIDLIEDMFGENSINADPVFLWGFVIVSTLVVAVLVIFCEKRAKSPLAALFLLITWACMFVSFPKAIIRHAIIYPAPGAIAEAGGLFIYLINTLKGQIVVHTIFTLEAIILTWIVCGPVRKIYADMKACDDNSTENT
ncbi:MAG: hypothetical protein ABIH23_29745 [bacterium]